MYQKKKIKKIEKQFERDNNLGMPFHANGEKDPLREEFIKNLIKSPDFVKTIQQNDKKYSEKPKDTIKRFGAFDWFIVFAFMAIMGGTSYFYKSEQNTQISDKNQTQKNNIDLILFTTLMTMFGLITGLTTATLIAQETKESNIDKFYNRLSVRLFDSLREIYPDLDENILKSCNPEMARVVTALIVANISEVEVREIRDIALNFAYKFNQFSSNKKSGILLDSNTEIKNALSIIEQCVLTDQNLHDAILSVYRGKIPSIFTLSQPTKNR